MTLDIHGLMQELSKSRPIFHSEADFQHALAWQIHESMPDSQIRLEYPYQSEGSKKMYLDIWLPEGETAIELKYFTRKLEPVYDGERFALKNQDARDISRYDFLKDIQRLERVVIGGERQARHGYAVLLTNDQLYWETPYRAGTVDAAFSIHEDRELTGELAWAAHAGAGTTKGREDPIRLKDSYTMHWQDYSNFAGEKYGKFRYLAVAVH